jgi:hypothetical protein
MKNKSALLTLVAVLLCSTAPALAATPEPTSTPDSCIELNHGDFNACNVGNSGAGNLPYRRVSRTPMSPDECIKLNGGDWNACNVGNSGAGNLPYLPISR